MLKRANSGGVSTHPQSWLDSVEGGVRTRCASLSRSAGTGIQRSRAASLKAPGCQPTSAREVEPTVAIWRKRLPNTPWNGRQ